MKNDLERDLRDLFDDKVARVSLPIRPPRGVLRRARRRQAATALTAAAAVIAVVLASIAGFQASRTKPIPTDTHTRSATLPYGSIGYPEGWYVVDLDGRPDGALAIQLTNFDPGLAPIACDALPPGGALLTIRSTVISWAGAPATWPVPLEEDDQGGCPGAMRAEWSDGDRDFVATAAFSPEAIENDHAALTASFASLRVAPPEEQFAEVLYGSPALIIATTMSPVGPVALYAYEDNGSVWVSATGPKGSGTTGTLMPMSGEVPIANENLGANSFSWGVMAFGEVSERIARVEGRTVEGTTFPTMLVTLPRSLGVQGRTIVWGFDERPVDPPVVVFVLYDVAGHPMTESYPTERRTIIASGREATLGRWRVFLYHCNTGTGFGYETDRGGGGSGCGGLTPLDDVMARGPFGGYSSDHAEIVVFASADVARIVFYAAGGLEVEGELFPMPDPTLGIPQLGMVFIPRDPPDSQQTGELVAFDADGEVLEELVESYVGPPSGVAPDPRTPAIVDASNDLLGAAWALNELASEPLGDMTFAGLDLDKIVANADEDQRIDWNAAAVAVPGEVSLRDIDSDSLVIASVATSGETFCIAVELDGRGSMLRFGRQDADSAATCSGGWERSGSHKDAPR